MANIETRLKRLGVPVDRMEPKPKEPVMARWLRSLKAGEQNRGITVIESLLEGNDLATVTIFEQQGPRWNDEEFTILHGVRKNGTDVFAILDRCIDERHLHEIVVGLPPTAWYEASILIQ